MSDIVIMVAADLDAAPAEVYALLSDYKVGHPSILPDQYFKDLTVEKGGQGAGTVIRFKAIVMGKEYPYHQVVSEPEPGRILQENDLDQDLITNFTFDPINNGLQTHLTITTKMAASKGIKGFFEKLLTPSALRPIYKKELAKIAARLQALHSGENLGRTATEQA